LFAENQEISVSTTLRGRVDRSRKAGRPRADDGDVIKTLRVDRANQSDAARQLVLTWIAQHLSARTYDDRQLSRIDMEAALTPAGGYLILAMATLEPLIRSSSMRPSWIAIAVSILLLAGIRNAWAITAWIATQPHRD